MLTASFSTFSGEKQLPLDAHLHYFPEHDGFLGMKEESCVETYQMIERVKFLESGCTDSQDETQAQITYKDFVNSNKIKTAFLVSPSFHIEKKSEAFSTALVWAADEKYISLMDAKTSEITQQYPGRFIGLCGLNYTWDTEDGVSRVNKCLSMPGMKGIKMHSFTTNEDSPLGSEKSQVLVDKTLESVSNKKPIVLWHIKPCGNDNSKPCNTNEIEFLFQMARKYPGISFVVAHSMYDSKDVEILMSLEQQSGSRLENLFLETSEADPTMMKVVWKKFGLDRVLFGSDNYSLNDHSLNNLEKNSGLSDEELAVLEYVSTNNLFKQAGINIDDGDRAFSEKSSVHSIKETRAEVSIQ